MRKIFDTKNYKMPQMVIKNILEEEKKRKLKHLMTHIRMFLNKIFETHESISISDYLNKKIAFLRF